MTWKPGAGVEWKSRAARALAHRGVLHGSGDPRDFQSPRRASGARRLTPGRRTLQTGAGSGLGRSKWGECGSAGSERRRSPCRRLGDRGRFGAGALAPLRERGRPRRLLPAPERERVRRRAPALVQAPLGSQLHRLGGSDARGPRARRHVAPARRIALRRRPHGPASPRRSEGHLPRERVLPLVAGRRNPRCGRRLPAHRRGAAGNGAALRGGRRPLRAAGHEKVVANGEASTLRMLTRHDRVGFSLSDVYLGEGARADLWYKHHWEANLVIGGRGSVADRESGREWPLSFGTMYLVGPRDRHVVEAERTCTCSASSARRSPATRSTTPTGPSLPSGPVPPGPGEEF